MLKQKRKKVNVNVAKKLKLSKTFRTRFLKEALSESAIFNEFKMLRMKFIPKKKKNKVDKGEKRIS